jgi:hypothetical protein
MAHEKQYEIVETLISQTESKRLLWEKTSNSYTFETSLGEFILRFSEEIPFDSFTEEADYIITILDNNGEVIERFDDRELTLGREIFRPNFTDNYYKLLSKIFLVVKRQALGTDKKIESFLQALKAGNDLV